MATEPTEEFAAAGQSWEGFPLDESEGQGPRPSDTPPERTANGDFILWHGTSTENAAAIALGGILPDDMGVVGVGTTADSVQSFAVMKGGGDATRMRLVVDQDWLADQRVRHEIGGSGHNQFLIGPRRPGQPWDGVPSSALLNALTVPYEEEAVTAADARPKAAAFAFDEEKHPREHGRFAPTDEAAKRGRYTEPWDVSTWGEYDARNAWADGFGGFNA